MMGRYRMGQHRNPPKPDTTGEMIYIWCFNNRVSYAELGRRCDLSHSYISRIVSGDRPVTERIAVDLADAMGLVGNSRARWLLRCSVIGNQVGSRTLRAMARLMADDWAIS